MVIYVTFKHTAHDTAVIVYISLKYNISFNDSSYALIVILSKTVINILLKNTCCNRTIITHIAIHFNILFKRITIVKR